MKSTEYFRFTRHRLNRAETQTEWIEDIVNNPPYTEMQIDGRTRKWGYVADVDKYLRVITLEDGETVHNAFFDRRFAGPKDEN